VIALEASPRSKLLTTVRDVPAARARSLTVHTIANRWGGGFEAPTFSQESGRFEKIGDVLHTFWNITEHSDSPIALFPYFYKTTYWQDALVLRTASLDFNGTKLKTNDITVIPPLLKGVEDYDLEELGPVDFSYRAVCCDVLIEKQSNRDLLVLADQGPSLCVSAIFSMFAWIG
jgi:hypothetical protein